MLSIKNKKLSFGNTAIQLPNCEKKKATTTEEINQRTNTKHTPGSRARAWEGKGNRFPLPDYQRDHNYGYGICSVTGATFKRLHKTSAHAVQEGKQINIQITKKDNGVASSKQQV